MKICCSYIINVSTFLIEPQGEYDGPLGPIIYLITSNQRENIFAHCKASAETLLELKLKYAQMYRNYFAEVKTSTLLYSGVCSIKHYENHFYRKAI